MTENAIFKRDGKSAGFLELQNCMFTWKNTRREEFMIEDENYKRNEEKWQENNML